MYVTTTKTWKGHEIVRTKKKILLELKKTPTEL
jgi:hypothetical protein